MATQSMSDQRLPVGYGNAICYSGYRDGQSPREGVFPSYEQVREDLLILSRNWQFLRLYDSGPHAEMTLQVIEQETLPFQVMLGIDLSAEESNPQCPWGALFDEAQLQQNRQSNGAEVERAIGLANLYPTTVFAVSIGNEASVEWTDHLVPVERLVAIAGHLKANVDQAITFCENYDPWTYKLAPLAEVLDFLSVHTYPAWEYITIEHALEYTQRNYRSVVNCHPDKPVVITEAGWTTSSNGRGIEPWNASEQLQAAYYEQLLNWAAHEKILTFVFEAFDEPWKGSSHPQEPEKHWGLFNVERKPKLVMQALYGE